MYRRKYQWLISQRQNRLRGILTKQLTSRNQSLIDEQRHRSKNKFISISKEDRENKIQERTKIKR